MTVTGPVERKRRSFVIARAIGGFVPRSEYLQNPKQVEYLDVNFRPL